jgi:hypothetical protein
MNISMIGAIIRKERMVCNPISGMRRTKSVFHATEMWRGSLGNMSFQPNSFITKIQGQCFLPAEEYSLPNLGVSGAGFQPLDYRWVRESYANVYQQRR